MEPEEEPRKALETSRRMAGHGSGGASPYRQGGGHGLAWIMGVFPGNHDIFGCGRGSDGTRPDEEADRSAGRQPVRARRPRPLSREGAGPTDGHNGSYGGWRGRSDGTRKEEGVKVGASWNSALRSCGRSPSHKQLHCNPLRNVLTCPMQVWY